MMECGCNYHGKGSADAVCPTHGCCHADASRLPDFVPPHEPFDAPAPTNALAAQVGGDHYKNMAIQPVEYIHRNGLGFIEGCVIKYVSRWRAKNGVQDLEKARHFLNILIELESKK